jgi:ABC-type xylose transport system permease subunit
MAHGIALVVAWLVLAIGLLGVAQPAWMMGLVQRAWRRPGAIWLIGALRLGLAAALWIAAPETRVPGVIRVLAGVSLLSGLATWFMPRGAMQRLLDWFLSRSSGEIRAWAVLAAAFGAALIWALG